MELPTGRKFSPKFTSHFTSVSADWSLHRGVCFPLSIRHHPLFKFHSSTKHQFLEITPHPRAQLEISGITDAQVVAFSSSHFAGISRSPHPLLNRRQTRVNLNRRDYARSALARFIGNPRARLYGNVGQIYHSGLTVQFSYLRAAGSGSRGLLKNRIPVRGVGEGAEREYDQIANKTFRSRFVKLFHGNKKCFAFTWCIYI